MIAFEYKDRRREGDTTLRQCQLAQLYILHAIDAVCKAHDLIYLLEGGTLLGAMRHNGFIPWDDDLDIGMPRRDYEKFLKIAPKELPEGLSLHTPSATPCVAIPFAKIRDRQSFYCECRVDTRTSDPSGIYVDIFPYDDVPTVGRFCQDLLVGICASSWMRVRYFYNVGGCNFFAVVGCAVLAVGCQVAHALSCRLIGLLNGLFGSKQVIACLEVGYPFRYEKDKMFPPSVHVFEDGEFPIPRDADGILTSQYGDWRQVPPPEKRPRHARIIDPFHAATAD